MDDARFDRLTRAFAGGSRRALLKAGMAAVAGGALTRVGLGEARAAQTPRGPGSICRKDADCDIGICGPKDRTGRSRCVCVEASDCPLPRGAVCREATCTAGVCGTRVTVEAACQPANRCLTGGTCNAVGDCVGGTPLDCDDDNVCTVDSCNPAIGCVHTPISCDDNNACTIDTCDPVKGCVNTPIVCDDNDPCTIDTCNAQTGQCVFTPKDCNDNNACTTNTCDSQTGQCIFTLITCNDSNPCTTDTCDPRIGCVYTPKYDLAQLNSEDLCHAHTCDAQTGELVKTPIVTCNDNNTCTTDACDPQTGKCVYAPIDCQTDPTNPCCTT